PAVTVNPVSKSVCVNYGTSFKVTATGTGLNYQWQSSNDGIMWANLSNDAIFSNVTTSELAIVTTNAAMNNTQYRCVVNGTCAPAATSAAATLTVDMNPVITTQPANTAICEGGSGSISVSATGTDLVYQWQVHNGTSWTNIVDGGIYSNATTASLGIN